MVGNGQWMACRCASDIRWLVITLGRNGDFLGSASVHCLLLSYVLGSYYVLKTRSDVDQEDNVQYADLVAEGNQEAWH